MFRVVSKGKYEKARDYLKRLEKPINLDALAKYGDRGVDALRLATPVDTGETRDSWYFRIVDTEGKVRIEFCNSHINKNVSIAIILQYGHGTGTGGWVEGRDYINPAIAPVFDEIAESAWKEITR